MPDPSSLPEALGGRLRRALIVDDLPGWREVIGQALRVRGFEVDAAATVEAASSLLARGPYHLLVVDLSLESTDPKDRGGLELLRQLRDHNALAGICTVILSAFGSTEDVREAFSLLGVADFLSKYNFGRRQFGATIEHLLSTRGLAG